MGITWQEAQMAGLDQNGVGVWPNASTWMRVESRSKSYNTCDWCEYM